MKLNTSRKTGQQIHFNFNDQVTNDASIHEYKTYFPHNNF